MTTVSDLGFTGLKIGQKFKDPTSNSLDYAEIISGICSGLIGDYVNVTLNYTDGTCTVISWWESDTQGFLKDYVLIEDDKYYWEKYQNEKPVKLCFHSNKRKVIVSNVSGYWFCPDCPPDKCDLGTLTEDEYLLAVKELYGGKECKRAPEMGQTRRRR